LLDRPRRDLVNLLADRGTELLEEDDVAIGMDGHDRDRAGMQDDVELRAAAVGEHQVPGDEADDATLEDGLLGLDPEFHASGDCSPCNWEFNTKGGSAVGRR